MNTVGRRYLLPHELARSAGRRAWWPAASIATLCLLAVVLPPGLLTGMNLYLLGLALLVTVAAGQPLPRAMLLLLLPFAVMLVVGVLAGFTADRYLLLKDAWYVSNPALLMAVGYVLARQLQDTARGLRAFVVGGALVAVGHLLWFVIHPELLRLQATQIRSISGTGYYAAGLACLVLAGHFGHWRDELRLSRSAGAVCLVLCVSSVVLSYSRTLALGVLVGGLAVAGFFSQREWLRVGLLVLAGLLLLLLLQASVEAGMAGGKNSFVAKLARSLDELRPTERLSLREINENWRGYETARALAAWRAGEPVQLLVGQGFGAQLDLGLFQNLSRNPRDAVRFIPIFHNGYVFVLFKTGLVGLVMYLAAVVGLYRLGRRHALLKAVDPRHRQGRLLQACAVVLLVTTWVIGGAFNKFDLFAFMLMTGFLVATLTEPERSD